MEYMHAIRASFDLRTISILILLIILPSHGFGEDQPQTTDAEVAEEETTLIYDATFFAEHPNAITALDMIRRIPSGNRILATTQNNQRGFATNEDRILINSRRITGKQNDSISALARIPVDQIKRIELIRGASPDIRVSSGEAVINVVLDAKENTNSGSWRLMAEAVEGVDIGYNGKLSYSGNSGKLGYVLSADRFEQVRTFKLQEQGFDGTDAFVTQLNETEKPNYIQHTLSAGITYTTKEDATLRVNASYQDVVYTRDARGRLYEPGITQALNFKGDTSRHFDITYPLLELSADYERKYGDNWQLKLLTLYTREDQDFDLGEDFLIENDTEQDDFQFSLNQLSSELIGRTSLVWTPKPAHKFEFGTEVAINKLDSQTAYFTRENGELIPVPLPGSDLFIKEFRDESFLNYTYKPNEKLTLDTSLIAEYSEIELQDGASTIQRDFFFLKPAVDIRYNLTESDQIQGQIKRRVDQLQFADFAASASIDNQTFGGNTDLQQMQRWIYEIGYEHRIKDDGGRYLIKLRHHSISDYVDLIPVDDGTGRLISAVGNVGDASLWQLVLEGSFRMTVWNLPNLVIEPRLLLNRTRMTNAFTGKKHSLPKWPDYQFRLEARHDISNWGFSYGGRMVAAEGTESHEIKDRFEFNSALFFALFAEYKLFDKFTLRLDVNDISNYDRGWNRFMFEDGTSSGIVTSRTLLEKREGLVYNLALSGTF